MVKFLHPKYPQNFKPVYWLNSIFENLNKDKVRKIGSLLMKEGIEVRSGRAT